MQHFVLLCFLFALFTCHYAPWMLPFEKVRLEKTRNLEYLLKQTKGDVGKCQTGFVACLNQKNPCDSLHDCCRCWE